MTETIDRFFTLIAIGCWAMAIVLYLWWEPL